MQAAIENFFKLKDNKKLLIIGDMFELGEESEKEHAKLGTLINELGIETLFCGKLMHYAFQNCIKDNYFPERNNLENWLKNNPVTDSLILIKGSRGMGLEKILSYI